MNTVFKPSFLRCIRKINNHVLLNNIEQIILSVENAATAKDIPELKKLKGYKKFYRIKLGDYRIGVSIENDTVTLIICMHRKDIYKFFP